jgi:hypothetical protein
MEQRFEGFLDLREKSSSKVGIPGGYLATADEFFFNSQRQVQDLEDGYSKL